MAKTPTTTKQNRAKSLRLNSKKAINTKTTAKAAERITKKKQTNVSSRPVTRRSSQRLQQTVSKNTSLYLSQSTSDDELFSDDDDSSFSTPPSSQQQTTSSSSGSEMDDEYTDSDDAEQQSPQSSPSTTRTSSSKQLPPPPRRNARVVSNSFDYSLDFKQINFRERPDLYRIGRGEQGVLLVEPYKSEILPHWCFATPEKAKISAEKIWALFENYLENDEFVGADMSRKFLQMGFTRARRYANHKGGKKYDGPVPSDKKGLSGSHGRPMLPFSEEDPIKAESAAIFKVKYQEALQHPKYIELKQQFLASQH